MLCVKGRNITGSLSLLNWNKIRQIFAQAKKEILEDFLSSRGILGALVLVNSEVSFYSSFVE